MAQDTRSLKLSARPPFNFRATVHSHGWRNLLPFAWDEERGELTRVERLSTGRVVRLQLREDNQLTNVVIVDISEKYPSHNGYNDIKQKVDWMLSLNEDLSGFYEGCKDEPSLRHVVERGEGRILRCPAVFEDVIKTICSCNCTWRQTTAMITRLVEGLGEAHPDDPSLRAFPTPVAIASLDEEHLQREMRLGYRASYILELSRRVAEGSLDLEGLKDSSLETAELRQLLKSIKGIGDYASAHTLALLGRYDYLGIDTWARRLVSQGFFGGEPVSDKQVEEVFAPFGKWKYLAYWFWDWEVEGDG